MGERVAAAGEGGDVRPPGRSAALAGGSGKRRGGGISVAGGQRIPFQAGGFPPSRRQRPRTRGGVRGGEVR